VGFDIRVYTSSYVLTGQSESTNSFLGWLNNTAKQTIDLSEVEGLCLDPNALLVRFKQPLVVVPKRQIVAIELLSPEAIASISVSQRTELCVLYTACYVIQGGMHVSGELAVTNLLNVLSSDYFPVSQARIYPILPSRKLPADYAYRLIVNRAHVHFYHRHAAVA
jgi:hypothetical protein